MMTFAKFVIFCIALIKFLEAASTQKSTIIFPDANANGNFNLPKNLTRGTSFFNKEDKHVLIDGHEESEANYISSIQDFATFYRFNLPKIDPFRRNVSISTRVGGSTSKVYELEQATCKPELHTVPLDLPQEEGVSYFPSCVRVERCGGCCLLSHHSCQPTSVQTIKVKAVKVQEVLTRSRRRVNRRNAESDFISVDVEQHLQCDCKCRLRESECNPAIHMYSEPQCECLCKDKDKEQACIGSRDHFWSYDQCECLCRKTVSCSSGQIFDHKTCRCVTIRENDFYDETYNERNFIDFYNYQG